MYSVSHSRHLLLSTCLEIQKFVIRQKQFQDSLDYEMANQQKLAEQELFRSASLITITKTNLVLLEPMDAVLILIIIIVSLIFRLFKS